MNITRMVRIVGALAISITVVGCGDNAERLKIDAWREVEPLPRAAEATAAVVSFYGLIDTPEVHWYGGAGLDCNDGYNWRAVTADHPEGECTYGEELGGVVALSDLGRTHPVRDTALTHELGHMLSVQLGEGGDAFHTGHVFAPGGERDQANALLATLGL